MVTTRASSAGFATPSADRIMRLEARVAEADVELAIAECHALTGVGCLQGEPADGAVVLRIWMPWDDSPGAEGLRDHLAGAGIAAHVEQAEEGREWQSALRDFHQPVVAGRIRVRPPWVAPAPGIHDVVIDPGMAFGTGQHMALGHRDVGLPLRHQGREPDYAISGRRGGGARRSPRRHRRRRAPRGARRAGAGPPGPRRT